MFVKFSVAGKVQGVFLRTGVKDYADSIGLKGTIQNKGNGKVEIIVIFL